MISNNHRLLSPFSMQLAVDGSPYSRLSAEYLTQFPLPLQTGVSVKRVLPSSPDLPRVVSYIGFSDYPGSAFPTPAELQEDERQIAIEERQAQAIVMDARQILEAADIKT